MEIHYFPELSSCQHNCSMTFWLPLAGCTNEAGGLDPLGLMGHGALRAFNGAGERLQQRCLLRPRARDKQNTSHVLRVHREGTARAVSGFCLRL